MKRVNGIYWFIVFLVIFLVSIERPQSRADIGGNVMFSLVKGKSKVTPGFITIGRVTLIDGTVGSFIPDQKLVGFPVGTMVELSMTFIPADEENDREMVEDGELKIEGYLQGGSDIIPMTWVPSIDDYFVGCYKFSVPENGTLKGGFNAIIKIWSTKGITEWIIVFIPINSHQEGFTLVSPYAFNIEMPKESGWQSHPIDFCSNIYACDGTGYYSWTDAKQFKLLQQNQNQIQQTVQTGDIQSSSSTFSQIIQDFLSVKTTSGITVEETNGFYFITDKPFSFLTVVTDPTDNKKELFRGQVKIEEWKKVAENLYVFVPIFSGNGRVFIDNKTDFIVNSSQKLEEIGNVDSFIHDFSSFQVVEIFPKKEGGN